MVSDCAMFSACSELEYYSNSSQGGVRIRYDGSDLGSGWVVGGFVLIWAEVKDLVLLCVLFLVAGFGKK